LQHYFRILDPEQLKAKDWIMWIAFKNNCSTFFIIKPLALYRKNPHSMTQSVICWDFKDIRISKRIPVISANSATLGITNQQGVLAKLNEIKQQTRILS
jgi:hypothetical protein